MSPLDYIKEGIVEGNWETVCEGYERLTGESLKLPEIHGTTGFAEDAIKQIAAIISSVVDGPVAEICTKPTSKKKKTRGRPKGSKKKSTVTKDGEDGEDASLKLDDSAKTLVQQQAGGVQLITNEADPEEVKANKRRAALAEPNKAKLCRQAARTFTVDCNECEKPFESTRPKGQCGQKCRSCLSSLQGRRG